MKVTVNPTQPDRKVVAVVCELGLGVFLPNHNGVGSSFIDSKGKVSEEARALEDLLTSSVKRRAIYEGDTITLQF